MNAVRARLAEAQLALMLLTRLPAGRLPEPVPTLRAARWAYPLVGLPVGLIGWGVLALCSGLPPLSAAFAGLAAMALATGGLHHDGLADLADGMGGSDRARTLEIMRDSRIGSFGVLALLMSVGLSASALSALTGAGPAPMLLVATESRLLMLMTLDLLPAARSDGLGQSAAGGSKPWAAGLATVAVLALLTGTAAAGILLAMAVAAAAIAGLAKRKLGGQTGDVLGAVQLASETAGWLAAALFLTVQ